MNNAYSMEHRELASPFITAALPAVREPFCVQAREPPFYEGVTRFRAASRKINPLFLNLRSRVAPFD